MMCSKCCSELRRSARQDKTEFTVKQSSSDGVTNREDAAVVTQILSRIREKTKREHIEQRRVRCGCGRLLHAEGGQKARKFGIKFCAGAGGVFFEMIQNTLDFWHIQTVRAETFASGSV